MKNLNPLYENLAFVTKKVMNNGIKKTIKNRKNIKKYLIHKYDDYNSIKDIKDLDEE